MVSENVTCPKCSHKNPADSHECVRCGVIFAKFYEFLERKSKEDMEAAAQEEQLEADAAAADKSEGLSGDSKQDVVKGPDGRAGADAAAAETATEGQPLMEEVEITIEEKPLDPGSVDGAAAKGELEDERHPEADGIVATETLPDTDSPELSDAMAVQNLAPVAGTETEAPAKPLSPQSDVAGRPDAEMESVSDDDEVLVLRDIIAETAADSAAVETDGGKDQNENLSARPEPEPAKKVKPFRPAASLQAFGKSAGPEQKLPPDWRSKLKHAMATKRDLKDIIRAYEGQSIAINYYDSTQIQEAELIFVNNLFFSAFIKNQNLLYSFPLHTVISVAEKIETEHSGKPAPHSKYPAVITISPPSYL